MADSRRKAKRSVENEDEDDYNNNNNNTKKRSTQDLDPDTINKLLDEAPEVSGVEARLLLHTYIHTPTIKMNNCSKA